MIHWGTFLGYWRRQTLPSCTDVPICIFLMIMLDLCILKQYQCVACCCFSNIFLLILFTGSSVHRCYPGFWKGGHTGIAVFAVDFNDFFQAGGFPISWSISKTFSQTGQCRSHNSPLSTHMPCLPCQCQSHFPLLCSCAIKALNL
jgi:hypothetical protein